MVRAFGVVFIGILIALVPFVGSMLLGSVDILTDFIKNQSLGILATILALNIASVTFAIGTLISIEIRAKKTIFRNTRKELHDNIIFMIVLFLLGIILVVFNTGNQHVVVQGEDINISQILTYLSTLVLVLSVLAMYEIVRAVFKLKDFLEGDKKDK